ncbi:MAG TPA: hypothetical protein VG147_09995 [Solirubrobacteraceae bacterium]|nr:hypothetical protein [Solirubrobacteraceae bacterium]
MKIMGLCLVAAFLMSAVAVATASAAGPLFLFSGTKKGFSSVSGAGTLFSPTGAEIKCTKDTDSGELEGTSQTDKVTNVVVRFTGCTITILGKTTECKTAGAGKEVITTNKLEGELGYIPPATNKEVGLVLKPGAGAGGFFASLECIVSGVTVVINVKGEVIGKITPLNKLVDPGEPFTLTYKAVGAKKTEQSPKELIVLGKEEKELLLLSNEGGGAFGNAGLETSDEVFFLQSTFICA